MNIWFPPLLPRSFMKACIWKNKKNTETTYCHILISYFEWGVHDDRIKIRQHQMAETPQASVNHTAAINMSWLCIKNVKIVNSLLLESEIMWQHFLKHCLQYKYSMFRKKHSASIYIYSLISDGLFDASVSWGDVVLSARWGFALAPWPQRECSALSLSLRDRDAFIS